MKGGEIIFSTGNADGITSISNSGLLSLSDVKFVYNGVTKKLNKTGTCDYIVHDVHRDTGVDVLTGTRINRLNDEDLPPINPSKLVNYPNDGSIFLRGDGQWTDVNTILTNKTLGEDIAVNLPVYVDSNDKLKKITDYVTTFTYNTPYTSATVNKTKNSGYQFTLEDNTHGSDMSVVVASHIDKKKIYYDYIGLSKDNTDNMFVINMNKSASIVAANGSVNCNTIKLNNGGTFFYVTCVFETNPNTDQFHLMINNNHNGHINIGTFSVDPTYQLASLVPINERMFLLFYV
jgi:hypothetical protein